ncbi:hypothetical protein HNP46_006767 [Pseudomonas nitritireducens]|uniref:TM2 domain-containing protein n=1 Tax=Pseudomonas nitroreducens TaxID=46680 RepID=A0A7W7P499_PSENT|nr:hypothetical protein [Pseudomonas nitritireducens]MBB4867848.1 hypothetical protein [Pseudomonas nitritireducens]
MRSMKSAAKALLAVAVLGVTLQGCTTKLIEGQEQELETYRQKGLEVHEKNPALAAGLGVLPMAGYFYTGHPFLAVSTLPLYPFLGPLWMPFDTHGAAEARNYYATKASVEREKAKALRDLDHKLEDKEISYEQHIREQRAIEAKYSGVL